MKHRYVIITPARNEEQYIENAILAIISQYILPVKWIIVSDGSIDQTGNIVAQYKVKHKFIELHYMKSKSKRNFASKVNAILYGYQHLKDMEFEFIGNLDADITFEPDYFKKILAKFNENIKVGIAGGVIDEINKGKVLKRYGKMNNVGSAIQLFRRECFEEIGGYIPLDVGGEDAAAEVMARMLGWEVAVLPEIRVFHHRRTGSGSGNALKARFHRGVENYLLGYHPVYFILKCIYRTLERPYLIGSCVMFFGYCWSYCRRAKRQVSKDFVRYHKREQLTRLWRYLMRQITKKPC